MIMTSKLIYSDIKYLFILKMHVSSSYKGTSFDVLVAEVCYKIIVMC